MPTPPAPTTTTVSPDLTSAAYVAEPQPVVTPHATRAALSRGMSSAILITDARFMTLCSANVPRQHMVARSSPPGVWWREVPSNWWPESRVAPRSHRFWWPVEHDGHTPQEGMNEVTTWSPTARSLTPGPTSTISPAPS